MTLEGAPRRRRRFLPGPHDCALLVSLLLTVCPVATRSLPLSTVDSSATPGSFDEDSWKPITAEAHLPTHFTKGPAAETPSTRVAVPATPYTAEKIWLPPKKSRELSIEEILLTFVVPGPSVRLGDDTKVFPSKPSSQKKLYDKLLKSYYDSGEEDSFRKNEANDENGDIGIVDQEMVESEIVPQRTEIKSKCRRRFARSPITSGNPLIVGVQDKRETSNSFLFGSEYAVHQQVHSQGDDFRILSALYSIQLPVAVDPIQGHISGAQYVPGEAVGPNNGEDEQLGQSLIWDIGSDNNEGAGEVKYESQYRSSPEFQRNRGSFISFGEEANYVTRNRDLPTSGVLYNSKETKKPESKNSFFLPSYSKERSQLGNKKRDLSPQYMTIGENNGIGRTTSLTAPKTVFSDTPDDPTLRNTLMGLLAVGTHPPQKHQGAQSVSDHKHVTGSVTSHGNTPFSGVLEHQHFVSISPFIQSSSDYDRVAFSSLPPAEEYNVGGTLPQDSYLQELVRQQGAGLQVDPRAGLHGDVGGFALFPPTGPHRGFRLFKRSVPPGALEGDGGSSLFQEAAASESEPLSVALAKRSPLATGYVAGIGGGLGPHHDQHHGALPPTVTLTSAHRDPHTGHHVVGKAATSSPASAVGSAAGGRGPNPQGAAPPPLVVLHSQPLVAAHVEDGAVHVVSALPIAVAHHHELHHEAEHLLSRSTTLALAPQVVAKATTVTTVTQHGAAPPPLLLVHPAAPPLLLVHHGAHSPPATSATSTTTLHSAAASHDALRTPVGGYGVGVSYGGAGAGHGFYAVSA